MSLHMFRKLRRIHGQQLYKNTYSLIVFENQNLHELFNIEKQSLEIMRGKVQFQNNRMLCYQKVLTIKIFYHFINLQIVTLMKHLKFNTSDSAVMDDISSYSNGDKAICNRE